MWEFIGSLIGYSIGIGLIIMFIGAFFGALKISRDFDRIYGDDKPKKENKKPQAIDFLGTPAKDLLKEAEKANMANKKKSYDVIITIKRTDE